MNSIENRIIADHISSLGKWSDLVMTFKSKKKMENGEPSRLVELRFIGPNCSITMYQNDVEGVPYVRYGFKIADIEDEINKIQEFINP